MQKLAFSRWIYFTYVQNYFSGPMAIAPMGPPLGRTVPNERNCNVKPRLSAMVIHPGGVHAHRGTFLGEQKSAVTSVCVCLSVPRRLRDAKTPQPLHGGERKHDCSARHWDVSYSSTVLWTETICIPRAQRCWAPGGATACNHGYRFNHSCKDVGEKMKTLKKVKK